MVPLTLVLSSSEDLEGAVEAFSHEAAASFAAGHGLRSQANELKQSNAKYSRLVGFGGLAIDLYIKIPCVQGIK